MEDGGITAPRMRIYMLMKKQTSRRATRREAEDKMINRFTVHFSPSMDERMVSVYLPPAYGDSDQAYPVMYMFDGQNAFEEREAAYGKAWHLDEFLNDWEKEIILVGLQSSAESDRRTAEYCPYHLAPRAWEGLRGRGRATMDYIAGVLKPMIDARYRTIPNRLCTGIMGASMGGLMSLYAVTTYNDVFSKAACVSPALSMCYPQLLRQIRSDRLDADTRIYLSVGESEARDQRTLALQTERMLTIANMAMSRGVRVYPYLQPEGRHCEEDWTRQTAEFLHFLWLE